MEFPGREASILIERQRAFKRCASVRANFREGIFLRDRDKQQSDEKRASKKARYDDSKRSFIIHS
jgi:hypothetical protein